MLGARRTPPVAAPAANSNTSTTVAISTAVGFRVLQVDDFAEAAESLKADIVVGLGDIPYGRALGSKRVEKATDRSIQWLQNHIALRENRTPSSPPARLFASLLPVSCANQRYYIDYLTQEAENAISGLALYSLETVKDLPESLVHLPRLGFTTPATPHKVLQHVALGLDVLTVPFVHAATDAGIALAFVFQSETQTANGQDHQELLALGIDMWSAAHATDLSPLTPDCECYTCTSHHRAYLQHLLSAKEMLGWVLLQIHNHHTMDLFFAGIRRSIADGTFQQNVDDFARKYESQLPEGTGQGPRVRGYQFRSEKAGEAKKNKPSFTTLDDGKEKLAESTPPSVDADASELEDQGFAEKAE